MKIFFDFFTIALFFVVYKILGMHWAIGSAMVAYGLQSAVLYYKNKKLAPIEWVTLSIIMLLGAGTFLLHNDLIFKWKPTVIYLVFAVIFIVSHFFGKKLIIEHLMDQQITLPKSTWKCLNISWWIFFLIVAAANLYVAYTYDTDTWVNFKLFGILGATLLFIIFQAIYLSLKAKHESD